MTRRNTNREYDKEKDLASTWKEGAIDQGDEDDHRGKNLNVLVGGRR